LDRVEDNFIIFEVVCMDDILCGVNADTPQLLPTTANATTIAAHVYCIIVRISILLLFAAAALCYVIQ